MRKALLALVVLLALAALAVLFWPREIEEGTREPTGNASVIMPSAPLPEEEPDNDRRAPERVEAPALPEETATHRAADPVASAPGELAATSSPVEPLPAGALDEPTDDAGTEDASIATGDAGDEDAASATEEAGTGEAAADRLAALSPPDASVDPQGLEVSAPAAEEPAPSKEDEPAAEDEPAVEEAGTAGDDAPVLDLVRVAPDGQAVIAGRARPRETVEIMLDDLVVGSVEADGDGGFVAILETETSAEPREMRLRVPRAARTAAAAPATGPAPAPAAEAAHPDDAAAAASFAVSAPFVILPGTDPAAAPVVVARGADEVDVVQPGAIEAADRMALDRLTYATGGDLVAAGRGPGTRAIRTYADGELVAEAPVGPDGAWRAVIPHDVAEGTSLLRFDEIGGDGAVVSRLEAPFAYAEEGGDQAFRQREVVIERGSNLWRIAEQHYGEGLRYSVIFQANSGLIRNPDLIYPGQVFTIPELVEAE